ncbi:unnamed protein product [Allacma fusca]|uniref:THO complex subunit 7 n=1 Tax=Allacma fusca TaxID=39272 RepID=A0A8J2PYY4_9HEXA|nr:unnamed protein product [Allacma fusca]
MASKSPPVPTVLENLMTDEVMKRRLLIDGDGGGDDRRIVLLTKTFLSFCSEEPGEEMKNSQKKLVSQINQIEHGHFKTRFATRANQEVKEMYVELDTQVKEEIEKSREEIENSKKLLELAKEHRKHQQEYNALAQLIRTQPDRKETEIKRQKLESELAELKAKQKSQNGQLDHRKRSMHVLMSAISRLQGLINEEEEESRMQEEAEKQAEEEKLQKQLEAASTPSKPVPMEIDDKSRTPLPSSNPGSPLEQITPDGPAISEPHPAGVVSSVPVSPVDPGKEKYEDLSESE